MLLEDFFLYCLPLLSRDETVCDNPPRLYSLSLAATRSASCEKASCSSMTYQRRKTSEKTALSRDKRDYRHSYLLMEIAEPPADCAVLLRFETLKLPSSR